MVQFYSLIKIFRRGNDRRGDRMVRDMEYRKNVQDDGYERNTRDRDQKGRSGQFQDEYQGIVSFVSFCSMYNCRVSINP